MPAERLDPLIHQQTRLQILAALYRNGRASFTDLRDGLDLTPGNLASHAARLDEAGLVRSVRVLTAAGFEAQYVITAKGAAAFEQYLAALREMLTEAGLPAGLSDKQTTPATSAETS